MSTTDVLEVTDLAVDFGGVAAVRGVGFTLRRGEVLGLVGESGSGKSATALAVMGLLPSGAGVRGSVRLAAGGDGSGTTELVGADDRVLSSVRGNRIGMVFQDPLSAFTPVYRIGDQIAEAIRAHRTVSRERARAEAVELLDLVGIPEPRTRAQAFPHEFSGGMRQRAMIAMAIANDPDVIVADEPTTALDVTVQAQVLDVLRTAQHETGAALLLVSHDLGVIAGAADRVAVMYAGRIVETAPAAELFRRPRMPYTLGLIGAVPRIDGPSDVLVPIPGSPPRRTGCRGAAPSRRAARWPRTAARPRTGAGRAWRTRGRRRRRAPRRLRTRRRDRRPRALPGRGLPRAGDPAPRPAARRPGPARHRAHQDLPRPQGHRVQAARRQHPRRGRRRPRHPGR